MRYAADEFPHVMAQKTYVLAQNMSGSTELHHARAFHKRPYVGVSQFRSWSHWFVLGAITWVFIAKSDQHLQILTFD